MIGKVRGFFKGLFPPVGKDISFPISAAGNPYFKNLQLSSQESDYMSYTVAPHPAHFFNLSLTTDIPVSHSPPLYSEPCKVDFLFILSFLL